MRVLVIGSGAREHALVWKLAQSRQVGQLYAAPGNPGMLPYAECLPIAVDALNELADFAERSRIDLTVVGPEVPLIAGIADLFRARGLRIFGPEAAGARLEGSKAFAKTLLNEARIPTAQHRAFSNAPEALAYLEEHGAPVVVKADGNALGKGAIVALDIQTARDAVKQLLVERVFGEAGDVVVIEDYLQGDEIGATTVCDGVDYVMLALTQDHKRALDGDQGLNTGGMGAYAPLPFVSRGLAEEIAERIIGATLRALWVRGIPFSGVLYSNIMLTERGPVVLEHNTRFGDPETQALMPLLKAELPDLLGRGLPSRRIITRDIPLDLWHDGYSVSLSLASGGYPGPYRKGFPIKGIDSAQRIEGVHIFHAGTAMHDGQLVSAGGRVLTVAGSAPTLREAVDKAYEAARRISFEGMYYRRDIGWRELKE